MKTALVLSGGGARGAYQVGVLKALCKALPAPSTPFSIITGVSVGALNAAVLASEAQDFHKGVEKLETIWRGLHCDSVYRTDSLAMATQLSRWALAGLFGWAGATPPRSLLDNSPLRTLLEKNVHFEQVNHHIETGVLEAIAITASSYDTNQAVTFYNSTHGIKPWTRARRISASQAITAQHVMASSALPLVFPAIPIDGAYYGDGALRENAPLSAAIHLGCDQILTIGARDIKIDPHEDDEKQYYPSVGDLAGQMLDIVFNDDADADRECLLRINQTLALIPTAKRIEMGLRPIDLFSVHPTADIRQLAGQYAEDLPTSVRLLLRALGAFKHPWVLPSYLAFEPGYISALIDLGERDGANQAQLFVETLTNTSSPPFQANVS
ncbi:MAG: patatin-like phospholipase family protein, partial [Pseudomonadota bacterium]